MNIKTKIDHWCEMIIEAGWLAALVVAPMFFNVFSSRVFEPDKISLVRTIAIVMVLAWLIKLANSSQAWLPAYSSHPTKPRESEIPDDDDDDTAAIENEYFDQTDKPAPTNRLLKIPFVLPILMLIFAYGISTLFSVARFVSWWGSYQRLQGTYSFLSYVIIAVLAIMHLRRPDQFQRLRHVIIGVSIPIAIYGIVQRMRLDPLPWGGNTQNRVAGNAGNSIFLSAYLIMAFFFVVERVYSCIAYLFHKQDGNKKSTGTKQELAVALAGGAYLFILLVQTIAILFTQSRGPLLGLLLGIYLFVLLYFISIRPRGYRIWVSSWVIAGVGGIALIILMNTSPIFDPLKDVPYVGRFTTLLDPESDTAIVRILIWQGANDMLTPHDPITFPDGNQDIVNAIRPLIGYGPEAMWVAYNPFYPPELAHVEARNASPDRSHNETWDALVITGIWGFIGYVFLFVSIFYWSLKWLGLIRHRRDATLFATLLSVFSVILVIIFYVYDDYNLRFFGVALPSGILAGLIVYLMWSAFSIHGEPPSREEIPRYLLIITILVSIAAHFVEIHFGIAIAATRTYFWIQTAMLLVVGMRWGQLEQTLTLSTPVTTDQASEIDEDDKVDGEVLSEGKRQSIQRNRQRSGQRRRQNGSNRSHRQSGTETSSRDMKPQTEPSSLPLTIMTDLLIFLTFVFIYTTNNQGLGERMAVLMSSITKKMESGNAIDSLGLFYLMLFTWIVLATIGLVAESLKHRKAPDIGWWIRGYLTHATIVWGGWFIYGLYQAGRLVPGVAGEDLDSQLNHVADHFAVYTWVVVGWLLVASVVYAWPWLRQRRLRIANHLAASVSAAVLLAVALIVIVNTINVALVKADIIYKQGQQFDRQGEWISSVELYRRALAARKTEDHYMLFLGRALLEQAKRAPDQGAVQLGSANLNRVLSLVPNDIANMNKQELLKAAEVVLIEAQEVNPLNTDHTANLARLYRTWADLNGGDAELRDRMLAQSLEQYEVATTLSPNSAHIWNE
ncbi:MAG: hypothetical protein AAF639_13870, partial [Chloroflexota bacterium]